MVEEQVQKKYLFFSYFPRFNSTLFTHFPETRVQRNVSYKLNGSNSKKLKGRYAKLIFSVETTHVLKKTTVNR